MRLYFSYKGIERSHTFFITLADYAATLQSAFNSGKDVYNNCVCISCNTFEIDILMMILGMILGI